MILTDRVKKKPDASGPPNGADLRSYFTQLKRRLQAGLLLAFLLPLAFLSGYFHIQFHATLKEAGRLNLTAVAESQRNTVALFLQERLVNIFSLFHSSFFTLSPDARHMEKLLLQLRRVSDAFIDVGFLTHRGIQTGYAGPYEYLQDKDYSSQPWFAKLITPGQNYHISDIYLGFRNKLHFTIAAKQVIDGQPYILRATLDPDKFYLFLETIERGRGGQSVIINQNGRFQVANPHFYQPLDLSDYVPPSDSPSGTRLIERDGESVLVAYAWLSETRWALLVSQPQRQAYAQLYRARQIMLVSTGLILTLVLAAIWFTTRALIGKARENAENRADLHQQLLHASKLASVGELATGVAHEINNPLAIILSTSGVVKDLLNPEFTPTFTPDQILTEMATIDQAVLRARGITQQLLDFGRKNKPRMTPFDVNTIIEEVLGGLKGRALALENVEVMRSLDPDLPAIMVDPNQIRQVFFNLISNAGDAISGPGKITVSSETSDSAVRVTIADTGSGITAYQLKHIFDPFYTTKEVGRGTGLGLSVSLGIVESMGGTIEVQSMPGVGSAFTVVLPIHSRKGATDGQGAGYEQAKRQSADIAD
jgi:two-component system NtrC family sensor kinase